MLSDHLAHELGASRRFVDRGLRFVGRSTRGCARLTREVPMRKSVLFMFGFVALAAFALVPHEAAAVKISQQNVKDVCGSKLQQSGGAMGCTKKCGLNGEHLCDFGCVGNDCNGFCLSCGVRFEVVTRRSANAKRVVIGTVRRSSRY